MLELAQKRVGMHVRVPENIREFSLPEDQRFYLSNQG
jgi:hypothetical protein